MPYFAGFAIALLVSMSATFLGLDKDRAFYPTVLAVVASYYVLFAAMGGSGWTLVSELFIMASFVVALVVGFKGSLWLVVAGLAAHGLLDLFHGHVVPNPGVPTWWPMFCMSYDISAAAYLALRLRAAARGHRRCATEPDHSFRHRIRPFIRAELDAARRARDQNDVAAEFVCLERAHVLAQSARTRCFMSACMPRCCCGGYAGAEGEKSSASWCASQEQPRTRCSAWYHRGTQVAPM